MQLSQADHGAQPPLVTVPRRYNAAHDLLARNSAWPDKTAFINAISGDTLSYGELTRQSHQFANALRAHGFAPESRVLVAVRGTPDRPGRVFGGAFWGRGPREGEHPPG